MDVNLRKEEMRSLDTFLIYIEAEQRVFKLELEVRETMNKNLTINAF